MREFVKKLQAAKRAEIEKEIEKMDDSGISRSTTPTSSRGESVSPIPFADIKQANKENQQSGTDVKQLCTWSLFTVYHLIRRQINTRLVIVTSFSNCLKYIQN